VKDAPPLDPFVLGRSKDAKLDDASRTPESLSAGAGLSFYLSADTSSSFVIV
jgi:hypothetical protein